MFFVYLLILGSRVWCGDERLRPGKLDPWFFLRGLSLSFFLESFHPKRLPIIPLTLLREHVTCGVFFLRFCMPLLHLKVTLLFAQGVCGCDRFSSTSIGDVIQSIVSKEGYRGLMRGWIPRMLFHAPAAAICWSTYEASKTFFQRLGGSNSSVN